MIKELNTLFIPYEEALALKELGFNDPCFGFFNCDKNLIMFEKTNVFWNCNEFIYNARRFFRSRKRAKAVMCLAPTFYQAFKWFREEHYLIGSLDYGSEWLPIWKIRGAELKNGDQNTFEECELECLQNLIKFVEKKKQL